MMCFRLKLKDGLISVGRERKSIVALRRKYASYGEYEKVTKVLGEALQR
jgi:hypothetical protein